MVAGEPLAGGFNPDCRVVRVGHTVHRQRHCPEAVRRFLRYLEISQFDGAPRYLGIDEQGNEILSYIEGDVPLPIYPQWAMTSSALVSIGELLARFHQVSASYPSEETGWSPDRADPRGGHVVCHNDLFPENIVFRDGRAVAFIDFEMAAPGHPLWDLAIAITEWAPLHAPQVRYEYPDGLDAVSRAVTLACAYGISARDVTKLVDTIFAARENALTRIRSEIDKGDPFWSAIWRSRGAEQATADDKWLGEVRGSLEAALAAATRSAGS
ncbi:MAG TPA: phosphotransferase [Streptosporangiaceae bacterium]|nr:phosphotransferase [Streptosporangiaceae bacterium]